MNLAIIGAGNVGGALGKSWARAGHRIVYGVREPTEAALRGAGDLRGKVLIDCTNPLKFTPGIGLELAFGFSESGAERVAGWATGAKVVKAFNTYGWENFADARYPNAAGLKPVMFQAGDDASAKLTVAGLAGDIGFDVFDTGGLRAARELEPLALIWIREAMSGARSANFTWARLTRRRIVRTGSGRCGRS